MATATSNSRRFVVEPTWRWLAGGVVGLGILWLALLFRYRSWIATNDMAILQLALEEMRDGRLPLVGTYSRLDFRHPGPAREWLFFVPYWLSGWRNAALPATTVLFHAAMFSMSVRAGWRWAATRGAITALVGVFLMYSAIGNELAVPWNPYLAATATFAASWGLLAFLRDGGWVQAVACASIAAQMHAPALPLGVTIVGIVAVVTISRRRSSPPSDALTGQAVGRSLPLRAGALAGLCFLWVGPVLDALGSESNFEAALNASRVGEPAGIANGLAFAGRIANPVDIVAGTFLRPSPSGLIGDGGLLPLTAWILVGASAFGLVVWRSDRRGITDLVAIALLALATVASVSRFVPEFYGHLFASATAVAVVASTATVSIATTALRFDSTATGPGVGRRQQVVTSLGVIVVLGGTALGIRSLNSNVVDRQELAAVSAVAGVIEPSRTYAVTAAGAIGSIAEAEVALSIERTGAEATSDIFSLTLPPDTGSTPLFIVAMTIPRQCLLDLGIGRVVLDGVIKKVAEPITILLIDPDVRMEAQNCLKR